MVSKSWAFTLNNYDEADELAFQVLDCNYMCYGREIASTGTKHLQGFVVFSDAKRLSGVRKLHPKAHWEITKKAYKANERYCKKEGDYFEKKRPRQQTQTGQPDILNNPDSGYDIHTNLAVDDLVMRLLPRLRLRL